MWLREKEGSLPSSDCFSILNVVGTSEEFVIAKSFEAVLPTNRELKSKFVFSIVMKGYLPIALSFKTEVCSAAPSVSFISNVVIKTFAVSDS